MSEKPYPSWDDLVEDHKRRYALSDEQSAAIWRRVVDNTDGLAEKLVIVRRRSFDEMHDQVDDNIMLAKPSANSRPTVLDRVATWWRLLWSSSQRGPGDPRS